MAINKVFLYNLMLVLAFFQAVGFFEGIDTQPNFFIFSTIIFLFISKKNDNIILLFVISMLLYGLSLIVHLDNVDIKYTITYLVSIYTMLYIYFFCKNDSIRISMRFLSLVVFIYTFVGVVQFFIPDFMSFLVSRSVDAALSYSDSGRGVRSLTGEPAHLGMLYILFNILFVFLIFSEPVKFNKKKISLLLTVSLFLINCIVSRSGYAILFHFLLFVYIFSYFYTRYSFFILLMLILLSLSSMFAIDLQQHEDIRAVKLFHSLIDDPSYLLTQGAIVRLFNIPITFNNLSYYGWWGAGNNLATYSGELNTLIGTLHYTVKSRVYGGGFEYLLRFGILGLPFVLFLFYSIFKILAAAIENYKDNLFGLYIFFALSLTTVVFQSGSLAQPVIWIVFFYITVNIKKIRCNN